MSQEGRGASTTAERPAARRAPALAEPTASRTTRALPWALEVLSPVTAVAAALWNRALVSEVPDAYPVFFGDVLLASCYPVVGAVVLGRPRTGRLGLVFLVVTFQT